MAEEGYKVTLNVYDLSQGLARQLSTAFLGKAIDGIWHTGVVVYGNEYFFGGGIQHLPSGTTPYGTPIKVVDLGITHVPQDVFEEYLQEISSRYSAETYSLLTHNCNNFSNEVAQFLVGVTIPEYILLLPNEVMNSPMGALIMPMIQNLESTLRAGAVPQVPQFRPPSMAQSSQTATVTVDKSTASGPSPSAKVIVKEADVKVKSDDAKPNEPRTLDTVQSAEAKGKTTVNGGDPQDPLGDARNKVQEEIGREFAAIMATGTFRASEAAALATKRVMQRYGHLNAAMPLS
ncbi:PREDICTED: desumoylating isopeptidase 1 [Populus euphratica]|uniref:Desumoylating isopeptidase 1 n=1 Tax=Populus euphratica TaxID=75702 RepID=A0AAJ6TRK4_POPEU|nr:PREDICTED: desumoylating isopeptidase 1-like [Populus euphratica]XP_011016283.1 PREDICTED: desumoylating isopeptidase 1-like [Populus euphratica]XP_011016284.1 PREDICTED: desumoylating isopeptidase 1-like [Populus euphratica]XP_011016285.1 PREDICTED: desumoylating isopeptidase 1-like [Populus euphratica]XP_011024695.1 PREDICTED: desumoylating isopeptidase 1 [Populus euphratica]XP_011024696.1 PREDICTED: desumoylating isopeptidase 1 [Populus euphratica]XP_011024697.1 PREDICTED: desumoylating